MKESLLLVDGSNLLFQMFYGMPARIINKDGKPIQGTLGFVGAFLKIIRIVKPTHVVIFFDGECDNERREIDCEYKANRIDYSKVAEDDNPFSQLHDVYRALDYLGVKHAETTSNETDDVIAGYAFSYGNVINITIASFDSDFFQLITDNVRVLRYRGDNTTICDTDFVMNRFGIHPNRYADYKSLVGDPSDNIKGAEKVGPKTAKTLINEYGSLENIIKNSETITKPSIKNSIINNKEKLKTNYRLIKLENLNELPFNLDELKYTYNGLTTTEVLKGINLK